MEWDELQLRMFDEDKHAKYSLRSLAISHSQQQQLTLLTLMESLRNGNTTLPRRHNHCVCLHSSGSNTNIHLCVTIHYTNILKKHSSKHYTDVPTDECKNTECSQSKQYVKHCSYRWGKDAECSKPKQCVKHCWPHIILINILEKHSSKHYCWQVSPSLVPRPLPMRILFPVYVYGLVFGSGTETIAPFLQMSENCWV